MNEVISQDGGRRRTVRRMLENLAWSMANQLALGGLCAWRIEEPNLLITRSSMPLAGLHPDLEGATLAHIADLHVGPLTTESYLQAFIDRLNEIGVDFVAITGDIITGPKRYAIQAGRVLKRLQPRIASLACLGNHDYGLFHPTGWGRMRGLATFLAGQLADAGVHVLRNAALTLARGRAAVQFVGLEDVWSGGYDPAKAFEQVRPALPTVALCHNPDAAPDLADRGAQWVLAGHTHGKALPQTSIGSYLFPAVYPHFVAGHYLLGDSRNLYVNRGLGHSRRTDHNSRPEITLFTLCRAEASPAPAEPPADRPA